MLTGVVFLFYECRCQVDLLLYEKVKATEVLRLELRRERKGSFGGRRRVAFTTLQIAICDFP